MIRDILRFNREAPRLLEWRSDSLTIGEYLDAQGYSPQFLEHYILPMGAAIWSAGTEALRQFPARYFVRFFHNHGMLTVDDRPQWLTVRGGSARYVEKLTAGFRDRIRLRTPVRVRATHPRRRVREARGWRGRTIRPRVLRLPQRSGAAPAIDANDIERAVLGAIRYQRNEVLLHTDTSVLPKRRRAWAAWNYHLLDRATERVAVTYHMNILQRIQSRTPLLVTLNLSDRIDERRVIRALDYAHPVFTTEAVAAQSRHAEIDGANRAYFCGAYWGFGFHEDGVASALAALEHFRQVEDAQRAVHRSA